MSDYWGYHLIFDASGAEANLIDDHDTIYNFTKQLVIDIDMVAYGEPQIVRFGSGNKEGYTLVQLIETSNICAHFVPADGVFYMDVFSCKPFDPAKVIELATKYFKCTNYKVAFLERQAPPAEHVEPQYTEVPVE
jgi:S-adenosylmethionine/arginine decarboxylase-like enzyme